MNARPQKTQHGREGYAILTVTIFAFIVVLAGFAIFAVASYETRGALYRQVSSEAFYLADGAIERARARFIDEIGWREGWDGEEAGRGTYDLSVSDTVYPGYDNVVKILSTGHVKNHGKRSIEVLASLTPTALGLAILIMRNADVQGNLCILGDFHVNGDADFGPGDSHLACDEDYTSGFTLTPPYMYTIPDSFPDATYYFVRGSDAGGVPHGRIFNRDGDDITTAIDPDSMRDVTSIDGDSVIFTFDKAADIEKYFDDATGIFKRIPPDIAAVVNFGEAPWIGSPPHEGTAHVILDGDNSSLIHTTIINTRYIGPAAPDSERVEWSNWKGGLTETKQITMEPFYGLALLIHDIEKTGPSHTYIGTPDWPALIYVTRDVVNVNAQFHVHGSLICLRDYHSTGGPDIEFDDGFLDNLPPWLEENWPDDISGSMWILRWREIAALD
jgi:hypothetical protein